MTESEVAARLLSLMTTPQLKSKPMKYNDRPHVYDDRRYELGIALKFTVQVIEATSRNNKDAVPSQPKDDVAIDIAVDGDTDRNVDGDPIDTFDMGCGGDVVTQDVESGIRYDERSYSEAGGRFGHNQVLDLLDHKADNGEIEWAYQLVASRVHPDENTAPRAGEIFEAVVIAYETLSDPQKCREFDLTVEETSGGQHHQALERNNSEEDKPGETACIGRCIYHFACPLAFFFVVGIPCIAGVLLAYSPLAGLTLFGCWALCHFLLALDDIYHFACPLAFFFVVGIPCIAGVLLAYSPLAGLTLFGCWALCHVWLGLDEILE